MYILPVLPGNFLQTLSFEIITKGAKAKHMMDEFYGTVFILPNYYLY